MSVPNHTLAAVAGADAKRIRLGIQHPGLVVEGGPFQRRGVRDADWKVHRSPRSWRGEGEFRIPTHQQAAALHTEEGQVEWQIEGGLAQRGIVGAFAGYVGGWVDIILSRIIELVMCMPSLVLILALIAVIEQPTIWHMMIVLGLTGWTSMARLTRAEFLKLRESEFVAAARCLGVSRRRIIFRHILPNALAPVMVPIAFGIAAAILIEAGLSLLGFGAPPPNPSWGTVLNSGKETLQSGYYWQLLFPGIAIFLTVLAYNLIGEGIQESTDPRLADPKN